MLRAERKDSIIISKLAPEDGNNITVPENLKIIQRKETYFGPALLSVDNEGINYKITAPGPDSHLLLWKSNTDKEGFCESWDPIAEIKARFTDDLPQYDICPKCKKPIKTAEHERLAIFDRCPEE